MTTVTVELLPDTVRKLREKAVSAGLSLESYLGRLADEDVSDGGTAFDQVVAPVRAAFRQSGMTDDDITDLVQEAREEAWQEKLTRRQS